MRVQILNVAAARRRPTPILTVRRRQYADRISQSSVGVFTQQPSMIPVPVPL
jgi:hypothetical protein